VKKELFVSKFKNNLVSKKTKVIYSDLINYFLVVILTFAFFICAYSINSFIPVVNDSITQINENKDKLNRLVGETRIQEYDATKKDLVSFNVTAKTFFVTLVKTSYYVNNEMYPIYDEVLKTYVNVNVNISETFLNVVDEKGNAYPLDNLSYYFLVFKSKEVTLNNYLINGIDYSDKKTDYLYLEMLNYDSNNIDSTFFISIEDYNEMPSNFQTISRFNFLKFDMAQTIMSYLVYGETGIPEENYNKLLNCYINASNLGVKDIEKNYIKYREINNNFYNHYKIYVLSLVLCLIVSYILAFIVLNVVIPGVTRGRNSIGEKIFKLGLCRTDEMEPTILNLFIYQLINFFLFFSSTIFTLFFMNILNISVFSSNGINLFQFIIFSLGLDLLSFIFVLINKNNQNLSLFAGQMLIKDTKEFEGISKEIEIDNSKDENGEQL
jgi:hypothetical protein